VARLTKVYAWPLPITPVLGPMILMSKGPKAQCERRSKISLKKFGVSSPLRFCGLYVKKRPLSQKVSFFTTEAQRSGNAEFFNAFALP